MSLFDEPVLSVSSASDQGRGGEMGRWERLIERVRVGGRIPVSFSVDCDAESEDAARAGYYSVLKIRVQAVLPDADPRCRVDRNGFPVDVPITGSRRVPEDAVRWDDRERLAFLLACAADLYLHELFEQFSVVPERSEPSLSARDAYRPMSTPVPLDHERPFDPHRGHYTPFGDVWDGSPGQRLEEDAQRALVRMIGKHIL